jgi:hypothetical protein
MKRIALDFLFGTLFVVLCSSLIASAQEPLGGQPPPDAKQSLADLDTQVAYQRSFEAVLWAMPAVAIYRLRVGFLEQPGMADNVIDAFSGRLRTIHEAITPNQTTP